MQRIHVGVLRGGPSSEYDVSLKSGAAVLHNLDREKYEPLDIFISKEGAWHAHGVPLPPERILRAVDVVFNVIHGEYGEDGRLQRILDAAGVPYTGSDALSSALVFNKHLTREQVRAFGVRVAHGTVVDREEDLDQLACRLFRSFPHPAIIKPVIGGSSVGVTRAGTFDELRAGLERAFTISPKALIEEYIRGREATVGVVDRMRGDEAYTLFPVEIIPPQTCSFFDYDAKYSGETIERCPGNFSDQEKKELAAIARSVHLNLGLRHYSRSDFIVSSRGIYFLEVNSAAACGLTEQSLLPKAVQAAGLSFPQFLDHVLMLALAR